MRKLSTGPRSGTRVRRVDVGSHRRRVGNELVGSGACLQHRVGAVSQHGTRRAYGEEGLRPDRRAGQVARVAGPVSLASSQSPWSSCAKTNNTEKTTTTRCFRRHVVSVLPLQQAVFLAWVPGIDPAAVVTAVPGVDAVGVDRTNERAVRRTGAIGQGALTVRARGTEPARDETCLFDHGHSPLQESV